VTVFDPSTVTDHATFEQPFQYASGVSVVIVNGKVALSGGERRGEGAGRVVKPDQRSH
jgi:N-acyl-D-amino-acid deacylase